MKSDTKKSPKKELEKSITDKFLLAIDELGHDAQKLKREIKKAAKFITKKIDRKIKAAKDAMEKVTDAKPEKKPTVKSTKAGKASEGIKTEKLSAKPKTIGATKAKAIAVSKQPETAVLLANENEKAAKSPVRKPVVTKKPVSEDVAETEVKTATPAKKTSKKA